MDRTIDYYFTPVSPYTYLGHERFVAMAARHGAAIAVKPVDYGRIFPVSGGLPLKQRHVFGAPTYIYRDELFWGQDRLDFLDRALAK